MDTTPEDLTAMIAAEMATLRDERIVLCLRQYLITPEPVPLGWDYGAPGETLPGWLVLRDTEQKTGIAWCGHGFGPKNPWGLVFLNEASFSSMGMDSGWYSTFLPAFFESFTSTRLAIWRIYSEDLLSRLWSPISDEMSWNEVWQKTMSLRDADPAGRYDVALAEERRLRLDA